MKSIKPIQQRIKSANKSVIQSCNDFPTFGGLITHQKEHQHRILEEIQGWEVFQGQVEPDANLREAEKIQQKLPNRYSNGIAKQWMHPTYVILVSASTTA